MPSNYKARIEALEKVTDEAQSTNHLAQVVMYDPATGQPLTLIDERAIKYIWIPGAASELEKYSR